MINKRITFALLYSEGYFYLSRNFRLQRVGDTKWLERNYSFQEACLYVDEIIFILVTKKPKLIEVKEFFKNIEIIKKNIFAPIIIGGAIKTFDNAKQYFENGADKIIINSEAKNEKLLNRITETYGSQAVSIMIDYKYNKNIKNYQIYIESGMKKIDDNLETYIKKIHKCNFGEIILQSIDKDGTGNGYDLNILQNINYKINKPILLMGGAGQPQHITSALKNNKISGVITANLYNFIGSTLKMTRELALEEGIKIAKLV
jgi:cyclase